MKVSEILNEVALHKKPKIKPPKPRPKKILWFQDRDNWHRDLKFVHGNNYEYHSSTEENEESTRSIYALDPSTNSVYGVWQGAKQRGVTFHKPRPLHVVKHPRVVLKKMNVPGHEPQTNIK